MVKPEYPTRQGVKPQASFSRSGALSDEADIGYEGEAGYSPDENAFLRSDGYSPTFQSYNRTVSCPAPSSVPRERISSLPNRGDEVQMGPSALRRGSVPVNMHYNSGTIPISTRPEVNNELPPQLQDIAFKGQELFWFVFNRVIKAEGDGASGSALTILPQR